MNNRAGIFLLLHILLLVLLPCLNNAEITKEVAKEIKLSDRDLDALGSPYHTVNWGDKVYVLRKFVLRNLSEDSKNLGHRRKNNTRRKFNKFKRRNSLRSERNPQFRSRRNEGVLVPELLSRLH